MTKAKNCCEFKSLLLFSPLCRTLLGRRGRNAPPARLYSLLFRTVHQPLTPGSAMNRTVQPSYATWIAHCFDHAVAPQAWYLAPDAPEWDAPAALTLDYLTQLFSSPVESVGRFSDAQLNQGFWYLASKSFSDHMYVLVDATLPEAARLACLGAIKTLFAQLFGARCTNQPSHGTDAASGLSALNSICFMWWEILPLHGEPNDPRRIKFDQAVLAVLRETLAMDSLACQESALHGLGHWSYYYRAKVRPIIDNYLAHAPEDAPLRAYARLAADGQVQ
jgi:hypothetical protein